MDVAGIGGNFERQIQTIVKIVIRGECWRNWGGHNHLPSLQVAIIYFVFLFGRWVLIVWTKLQLKMQKKTSHVFKSYPVIVFRGCFSLEGEILLIMFDVGILWTTGLFWVRMKSSNGLSCHLFSLPIFSRSNNAKTLDGEFTMLGSTMGRWSRGLPGCRLLQVRTSLWCFYRHLEEENLFDFMWGFCFYGSW